jgi:hypothetical protein
MWVRRAAIFVVALPLIQSASIAMRGQGKQTFGQCTVIGSDNLPAGSGGAEALCRAIEVAIASRTSEAGYHVEVKVVSPSRLSATPMVNGRVLPEQKFAVMDRELNPSAFQHFAEALAISVAAADKQ